MNCLLLVLFEILKSLQGEWIFTPHLQLTFTTTVKRNLGLQKIWFICYHTEYFGDKLLHVSDLVILI